MLNTQYPLQKVTFNQCVMKTIFPDFEFPIFNNHKVKYFKVTIFTISMSQLLTT